MSAPQLDEGLLLGREQTARLFIGFRGDHVHGQHRVGLLQTRRRTEVAPVDIQRLAEQSGGEVGGECIWQTQHGRETRPKQAGSQDPYRHVDTRTGHGTHGLSRDGWLEIAEQLDHVGRKFLGIFITAPQRARGGLIGAWRAAETEIDAPRIE